jgi:D-alanine-D-alanine ligase
LRVAVLFGGQSSEHEVSLVSARAVIEGLDPEKYEVVPIGISKAGRWLIGSDTLTALEASADPNLLPSSAARRAPSGRPPAEALSPAMLLPIVNEPLPTGSLPPIDVVFPVLHGPRGEDGTVQGLFELAEVPYVGCGVLASAVGMDKPMMKGAFAAAGLPQVHWRLVRRVDWESDPGAVQAMIDEEFHFPIFIKPANMGSSVGITRAVTRGQIEDGLNLAAQYDRRIVIEQGLIVREIEVSVLGNDEPEASVPGEIIPSNQWYDYEAKYLAGASRLLIPAPLTEEQRQEVRELALRAFKAIDGTGLARVDFLLDSESSTFYVNEINTMPGFTPVSMYAKLWEASGLSYRALLDRLIDLAMERHGM